MKEAYCVVAVECRAKYLSCDRDAKEAIRSIRVRRNIYAFYAIRLVVVWLLVTSRIAVDDYGRPTVMQGLLRLSDV